MRTIKMALLLAVAALMTTALAAPGVAGASYWTKEGSPINNLHWTSEGKELTESSSFGIEGPFNLTSENGGFDCSLSAAGNLTPGTGGSLTKFELVNCIATDSLDTLCGGSVSATVKTMSVQANASTITILDFAATFVPGKGIFCPKSVTVSGKVTLTPTSKAAIADVSLSGQLSASYVGMVYVNGSPTLTPAGKYGIANSETVDFAGDLGFANETGSVNCSVNGEIELEPGSSGKIIAIGWSNCLVGGGLSVGCGSVSSATAENLPWAAEDTGSTVKVSGVSFTLKSSKGCQWKMSGGTLTLTPNDPNAISTVSVLGSTSNWPYTWSGSWNWSPAGVVGL